MRKGAVLADAHQIFEQKNYLGSGAGLLRVVTG